MIVMAGFDRLYEVPRTLRHAAARADVAVPAVRRMALGRVPAWDLLDPVISSVDGGRAWADKTLASIVSTAEMRAKEALDCTECEDTGFYGLPMEEDSDTLIALFRERPDGGYQILQSSGVWENAGVPGNWVLELLDLDLAQDLADAVLAGGTLTRRYCQPRAFLPPCGLLAATPGLPAVRAEQTVDPDQAVTFAIVDELDTGAVLEVVRISPGPNLERYVGGGNWDEDPALLATLRGVKPPPLVELDPEQAKDVLSQVDQTAAENPKKPKTAAGLVADAPLTVSSDPRAEKLRRYWSSGKGAAKIRWGTPGDWKRCVRHLSKYMPGRAEGYCNNLHKRATGVWTGDRRNPGRRGSAAVSTIEALAAAIQANTWAGESGGVTMLGIKDGIYEEKVDDQFRLIVKGLVAGAFPVAPPEEWFFDPKLHGETPLVVEDTGQVYGHLASFQQPHIGLPGQVRAPHSRSNYAYFRTGAVRTASGKRVPVGQLTLAGGHAPLHADAGAAVAHYDNTNSAVADVAVGEDRYGIWFAGALRPDVTPEQIRTFMASALSGDWRPINGNLELVACCSVNVPGFPIARAMAASGAITALVAAGARSIALHAASMRADAAVVERLEVLERQMLAAGEAVNGDGDEDLPVADAVDDSGQPVDDPEQEAIPPVDKPVEVNEKIERARALVAERRRARLRARVHPELAGVAVAAGVVEGKA